MKWINTKDELPVIPEGKYAIQVLVAVYDYVYEEINPGNGTEVYMSSFMKGGFYDLTFPSGTYELICDEVTHWMYKPEPPKRKET